MNKNERNLVVPGDVVGDRRSIAGTGTKLVGDRLVAVTAGLLQTLGERVMVVPMTGTYDPKPGDLCVAIVKEANPGNWILDIRAPWLAPLHVSEAPWRVEFGETMQYLKPGDAVLCKVLFIDEQKKVQVTLKDRNLSKLEGGEILEVPPVAIARVIGKNGSMVNLLKEYVECWMFVGQNGRIWLNGAPAEVQLAKEAIRMIARESHLSGVTDRVKAFLEQRKPGGIDAGLVVERAHARRASAEGATPGEASGERDGRAAAPAAQPSGAETRAAPVAESDAGDASEAPAGAEAESAPEPAGAKPAKRGRGRKAEEKAEEDGAPKEAKESRGRGGKRGKTEE